MSGMFINTVEFRFSVDSPRPSWTDIVEFVKQLDGDLTLVESVYNMTESRSICIKFASEAAMLECLRKNPDPRKIVYANGNSVEVCIMAAGRNVHYVRVFDIPPEVSDDDLVTVFNQYGKVKRTVREKFPTGLGLNHVHTGVRGVYIDIDKEIPPLIEVNKQRGKVFYDGLKDKCFFCHSVGHRRNACPARKKTNKPKTFAKIVSTGQVETVIEESDPIDDNVVEVVEEMLEENPLVQKSSDKEEEKSKSAINDEYFERTFGIPNATQLANNFDAMMKEKTKKLIASQRRAQFASSASGSTTDRTPPRKSSRKNSK
ncbi:uncharacterized protein LOC134284257 [Aedes albopictus]|uniref:CCHC-type domain-containing protein n=1 Tax=Aedes albopictus TaxID=7160 RepID=A0ABM1ZPY7_AEDAL